MKVEELFNLAKTFLKAKRYIEAATYCEAAIKQDNLNVDYHEILALTYSNMLCKKQGHCNELIEAYENALLLNPNRLHLQVILNEIKRTTRDIFYGYLIKRSHNIRAGEIKALDENYYATKKLQDIGSNASVMPFWT